MDIFTCIPAVDHKDLFVVARQKRHKAVGKGILDYKQAPPGVCVCTNVDFCRIFGKKYLITVKSFCCGFFKIKGI